MLQRIGSRFNIFYRFSRLLGQVFLVLDLIYGHGTVRYSIHRLGSAVVLLLERLVPATLEHDRILAVRFGKVVTDGEPCTTAVFLDPGYACLAFEVVVATVGDIFQGEVPFILSFECEIYQDVNWLLYIDAADFVYSYIVHEVRFRPLLTLG